MPNNAVNVNPNVATLDITTHASDFLWAVFCVMMLTDLLILAWMFTLPKGQRVFHQLAIIILTTASISYFSMASDLGATGIVPEFIRDGNYRDYMLVRGQPTRSIWYVRYIDWVVTTPCLLLELLLVTGLPLSDIITCIFFDLVMIITGLVGALVTSRYKWGYWTMGCFAMFYVFWVLIGPGRGSAKRLSVGLGKSFTKSTAILLVLWMLYPVAWALCDGGNVISPTAEMIFYGILDMLAKPVFTLVHLYSLKNEDLSILNLQSGKYSEGAYPHHLKDKSAAYEMSNGTTGVNPSTGGLAAPRPDNIRRRTSDRRVAVEGGNEVPLETHTARH